MNTASGIVVLPALALACATAPLNAPPEATCRFQRFSMTPGKVVLQFTVNEDGDASDFLVKNADAPPDVVRAAEVFVAHCHFNPALRGGKPVKARITQVFTSE